MVTISSKYLGKLRTEAVHLKSGEKLITDAPVDNNGKGESFSPTDLVCVSLVSCMMTIMGIRARQDGYTLDGLEADISKEMTASPRKIKTIHIVFTWANPAASGRKLASLKEAALSCPVALSLSNEVEQKIEFHF